MRCSAIFPEVTGGRGGGGLGGDVLRLPPTSLLQDTEEVGQSLLKSTCVSVLTDDQKLNTKVTCDVSSFFAVEHKCSFHAVINPFIANFRLPSMFLMFVCVCVDIISHRHEVRAVTLQNINDIVRRHGILFLA